MRQKALFALSAIARDGGGPGRDAFVRGGGVVSLRTVRGWRDLSCALLTPPPCPLRLLAPHFTQH